MNRRILVTGGAGFIGSHAVDLLLARGDTVEVIDDLSKGRVSNVPDGVAVHVADISDRTVERIVRAGAFDAIVHCAAQTNVGRSIAEPLLDRRINVEGLQRVLEAAGAVSTFVFISSGGAIYGETSVPAAETATPAPQNPYGWNKLEGEAIVAQASPRGVSLRLSNVYGARQRADTEGGVISIFTARLVAGLPLQIYGDGEQTRDFVHVRDVVSAIALAIDDASMTGVWNVGTGAATSVNEVAGLFSAECGSGSPRIEHLPARGEVRRSCLDVGKLRATARWAPETTLPAGIVAELKAWLRGAHARPSS